VLRRRCVHVTDHVGHADSEGDDLLDEIVDLRAELQALGKTSNGGSWVALVALAKAAGDDDAVVVSSRSSSKTTRSSLLCPEKCTT
jgi:hypothetical protein